MRKILLVEDDRFKSDDIQDLIKQIDPLANVDLATNVSAAIIFLTNSKYDLIVIDMALPSHPLVSGGGSPLSLLNGGMEILFELQSLAREDCCIVITQYPEIEICGESCPVPKAAEAINKKYGIVVHSCLEYSQSSSDWRSVVTEAFEQICKS